MVGIHSQIKVIKENTLALYWVSTCQQHYLAAGLVFYRYLEGIQRGVRVWKEGGVGRAEVAF